MGDRTAGDVGEDELEIPKDLGLPMSIMNETLPENKQNETALTECITVFIYFVCSSLMLIFNKAAVNRLPFPVMIAAAQTVASALLIEIMKFCGYIEYPNITWVKLFCWKWVGLVFAIPIICNMRAMKFMDVEAIMTFRSCTTIIVAISDVLVLKSKVTFRQMFACCIIFVGGCVFAVHDAGIPPEGWVWGGLYSCSIVVNTIYIKHVFTQQSSTGPWEKSLLNNLVASPFIFLISCAVEDFGRMQERVLTFTPFDSFVMLLSCVGGFGISVSGTYCRQMLSATGFDVLGNCTKYATLAFNGILLGSKITAGSMIGVLVALSGGVIYSPATSLMCSKAGDGCL